MTDPTDSAGPHLVHTTWCDPAECASSPRPGWHWSAPWTLPSDDPIAMIQHVAVLVGQLRSGPGHTGDEGPPWIDLTVHISPVDETDTEDDDYTIVLTPERALALGHLLITAGQAATQQPSGPSHRTRR